MKAEFLNTTSGVVGGSERNNIYNSYYHSDSDSIVLFFPDPNNKYQVVGTSNGDYNFIMIKPTETSILFFTATGVITAPGAIHNYDIDWDVIARGEEGATLTIDQNGDGVIDTTIHSDWELTPEEFTSA